MIDVNVRIPATHEAPRRYAISVLLDTWLGYRTQTNVDTSITFTQIKLAGHEGELRVVDGLFAMPASAWLTPESMPVEPLRTWDIRDSQLVADLAEPQLPVIFGQDPAQPGFLSRTEGALWLGLDVFGSAFFMLTRYEEAICRHQDEHGRFPASEALAVRGNFLHRPIVLEYLEVLKACLLQLWGRLPQRRSNFVVVSTHDVDDAFAYVNCGVGGLARSVMSTVAHTRSAAKAVAAATDWLAVRRHGPEADPLNTFGWIMDSCEDAGIASAFFFIPDPATEGRIRRRIYRLTDPEIADLISNILRRGHEIGIHPSYRSHLDAKQLLAEAARFRAATAELGFEQSRFGGRQHFLRWQATTTWANWDDAGLAYDSTLAYAERPGFRAGTCRPYPTFDLERGCPLPLVERPLILMDVTVSSPKYLGLNPASQGAHEVVAGLRRQCAHFGGEFVILWHNSELAEPSQGELYRAALFGESA